MREQLERDPISVEQDPQVRGVNVEDAAELSPAEAFGPVLWALAVEREEPQAAKSSVTGDGAEWICLSWPGQRNLAADYSPDSEPIVDWYHACDHLHQAACALHPESGERAEGWFKGRQDSLFLGEVQSVTAPLDDAGLPEHAHYFHTHQWRRRCQEFREEGYPIGSGTVESGIKQFKARLTGPGMRWSRPGVERMLGVRGAVIGHNFDELWAAA